MIDSHEDVDAWRRRARAELRRSRRYLLSLVKGLTEEESEWTPLRADGTCVKWHAGHAALLERQRLSGFVSVMTRDDESRDLPFRRESVHDRTLLPPWKDVLDAMASTRKLTDSLVALGDAIVLREPILDVINAEYRQAAFVDRLRREMGKPPVAEPRSELLQVDTDGVVSPRHFLIGWDPPNRRPRSHRASVVSLRAHRMNRARRTLERGHELVNAGDYRAALREFERAELLCLTADALTYQGWMHSLLGDTSRAERLCRRAIELDPDFGNPYNDIGTICLQRREVEAAIQWFERAKRARRYEPRHFPFLNLGRLYLSLGMPDRALEEFEGALRCAPGNEEATQAIEQIRSQLDEEC